MQRKAHRDGIVRVGDQTQVGEEKPAVTRGPHARARRQLINLLRPSPTTDSAERWSTALTVDPHAQLREIAQLVEHGLVSATEFDAQRRKVSDS